MRRFEKCLCFTLASINYYEDLLHKFSILIAYFPLANGGSKSHWENFSLMKTKTFLFFSSIQIERTSSIWASRIRQSTPTKFLSKWTIPKKMKRIDTSNSWGWKSIVSKKNFLRTCVFFCFSSKPHSNDSISSWRNRTNRQSTAETSRNFVLFRIRFVRLCFSSDSSPSFPSKSSWKHA